jgi:hypothetical protein
MARRLSIWWLCLALIGCLVLATYAIALNAWWVGDDYNYVQPKGLDQVMSFFNPVGRALYRPLNWSSWALDFALFGPEPLGWRLTSVAMHLSNTLFAALLVREITGKARLALLAAALFAVHPAATETVTWIAGRADVSYAFAWLPALWLWVKWRKGASPLWWIGAGILGFASFLGKETALTLPVISLWIDLIYGREWARWPGKRGKDWWRDGALYLKLLRDHSLFILAGITYMAMRFIVYFLSRQAEFGYGEEQLAFLRDPGHALNVVTGYFFMALGLWWVPQELMTWATPVKIAVLVLAVAALYLLVRWLRKVALFGIGWTAFTLVLTLQAVAPRWFYVPALGIGLLAAAAWWRLREAAANAQPAKRNFLRTLAALPLLVLVVWGLLTFAHNELWRQSGEEARRILREVEVLHPDPQRPTTIYVANPPYGYKGVLLFNSGFDTAMHLVYLDWPRMRAYNLEQHTVHVAEALADPSKVGPNPIFLRYEEGHIVSYPSLQALAQADGFGP